MLRRVAPSEFLLSYFAAERSAAIAFVAIGTLALIAAAWAWWRAPSWRGAARPLLAIAVLQLVVGATVWLRTDAQVERHVEAPSTSAASKVHRIGILAERSAPDPMVAAFVEGLRDLGYVEGRNIVIERRYALGATSRYSDLVAELVQLKVDVLVVGGAVAAKSARAATTTVPIVFASVGDPVAAGLVTSLSRPGGNATGLSNLVAELGAKQLELLKLAAPRVARITVIHNPLNSGPALAVTSTAAQTLGLELHLLQVRQSSDMKTALSSATTRNTDAILALSDPVVGNSLAEISELAAANGWPSIYSRAEFADKGGLLAYGPSFANNYRRAATYVDKLLRGEQAGELPVEQPTAFELVVNIKTARTLGLTMPQSLLQRADRVIE